MRAMMVFFLLLIFESESIAEVLVTDADTLIVNSIVYRLDGIDAPETDQVCLAANGALWNCGIEARDQLRKFVGSRDVRCQPKGLDPVYRKRRIGICLVEGETINLNQWLVRAGWALNFEPYAKGRFKADEQVARDRKEGLWAGCFSTPRHFRNSNRDTAELLGSGCSADRNSEARNLLFPVHPAMPPGCSIKGKYAVRAHFTEHRGIYHVENCGSYKRTKTPDRWFCSEREAQAEGFRKSFTCGL